MAGVSFFGIFPVIVVLTKAPCEDNCDDENQVERLSRCQKIGSVPLPETLIETLWSIET